MLILAYSRHRLHSFLIETARVTDSDFPYSHSIDALARIRATFQTHYKYLLALDERDDQTRIRESCVAALQAMWIYLPLVGFILRSTNIRNSFEVYGPFLRLARAVLGSDSRLVLSSEWDYSPFTYRPLALLPGFVFIGLPAPESGNPLLTPLAGHELGHALWARNHLQVEFETAVDGEVKRIVLQQRERYLPLLAGATNQQLENGLFVPEPLRMCRDWTVRQAEESFCDFVGVYLFGEAYLHAFAYLLSPTFSGQRSVLYPNLRRRAANLVRAARQYAVIIPSGYADLFDDQVEPAEDEPQRQLMLWLADACLEPIIGRAANKACDLLAAAGAPQRDVTEVERIRASFRLAVPAQNIRDLSSTLNAGWAAYHDTDLWKDIPQITDRTLVLKELMLKTIEVFETEQILASTDLCTVKDTVPSRQSREFRPLA